MIKQIEGNIFDCKEDIICHQTNCQGVMGHGIALQVKERYPKVYNFYKKCCELTKNKKKLLGTVLYVDTEDGKIIANIFGQLNYGEGLQTNYGKMAIAFNSVHDYAKEENLSVAIPYKIGCGLAHGDWNIVSKLIENIFDDIDCTIYKFERNERY